ncbi:MAG: iron-sulfur cluster assembly accessory protein [Pseudomonadota bacterium]
MTISLTDNAADRVRGYLNSRENAIGLRLGVSVTGCSGYSYVVDLTDEMKESDVVFEDKGIKVLVDAEALPLVEGTEVDFIKDGLNEMFRFTNPNAAGECGCGESFTV